MTQRIIIDIETRSTADLKKVGTPVYAADPTTTITHIGWKNGAGTQVWQPARSPIPNSLYDALADERVTLVAHNAGFERHLLSGPAGHVLGLPGSLGDLGRWDCTAARSAHVGLPRGLESAARILRLRTQKDAAGHRLMLQVSKPRTTDPLVWWTDDERMDRLAEYCRTDVEVESELDQKLPALSAHEREVWLATERLNDRGVCIDQVLLQRLIPFSAAARRDLDVQVATLTGGMVPRVSNHAALTRWLVSRGINTKGVSKEIVQELLNDDRALLQDRLSAARLPRGAAIAPGSGYPSLRGSGR